MTYTSWLNSIMGVVNGIIVWANSTLNALMNNYIFKTIVYFIILSFIFSLIIMLLDIIKNNFKHTKNDGVE